MWENGNDSKLGYMTGLSKSAATVELSSSFIFYAAFVWFMY